MDSSSTPVYTTNPNSPSRTSSPASASPKDNILAAIVSGNLLRSISVCPERQTDQIRYPRASLGYLDGRTNGAKHRARMSFTALLVWLAIGPSHKLGGGLPISSKREETEKPPPQQVPHPYFKV